MTNFNIWKIEIKGVKMINATKEKTAPINKLETVLILIERKRFQYSIHK